MRTRIEQFAAPCVLTLFFISVVSGQGVPSQEEAALWAFKAEAVSESLNKDAAFLEAGDRALLYLELGIIWWQDDSARARAAMSKAIEVATTKSLNERPEEAGRRLKAARKILEALEGRDKELGAKLAEALASTGEQLSGDDNAEALVSAALAVVTKEPARAASMGVAALRAGRGILRSGSFFRLLKALLSASEKSGNKLFSESLTLAQAEYDESLVTTLAYVAFPATFAPNPGKTAVPVESLRVQTLELVARNLLRAANRSEEEAACLSAPLAAQLSGEYGRLLPEEAPRVRSQVGLCQSKLDSFSRESAKESQQPELTADEHLRKFREDSEYGARIWHYLKAMELVERARDFDQGISLLDGLNDKERTLLGEMWKGSRVKFATAAGYAAFKGNNYVRMYQIINAVPPELRPMAQIFLAEQVAAPKPEVGIELMEAARRALARLPESEPAPPGLYFLILGRYATLNPPALTSVFTEAAAAMDLYASRSTARGGPADEPFDAVNLPAGLLHLYSHDVEQTAATIKNARARVQVRLGIIRAALRQKNSLRAAQAPPHG